MHAGEEETKQDAQLTQSLRIDALERKLHVLHAFVEGHDVALRDFKKEVRNEKRFEQLFQQAERTKNSSDYNMQEIVKLQEAMARQGTQIKEYQLSVEKSQKNHKEKIEMGYK